MVNGNAPARAAFDEVQNMLQGVQVLELIIGTTTINWFYLLKLVLNSNQHGINWKKEKFTEKMLHLDLQQDIIINRHFIEQ